MGLTRIQPSRRAAGPPEYKEFLIQGSATFPHGAPMQRDTVEGEIEEHAGGATVTGLVGFAAFGVAAGVPAGKGSTAFGTKVTVAIANADQVFVGMMINSTTIQTPNAGNNGTDYGLVKVSGEWYVDEADETNVHVWITDFDANRKLVFFKVIGTVIGL